MMAYWLNIEYNLLHIRITIKFNDLTDLYTHSTLHTLHETFIMNFESSPLSCYFCKICTLSDLVANQILIKEKQTCHIPTNVLLEKFLKSLVLATDHTANFIPDTGEATLTPIGKCSFTYEQVLHRSIERLLDSKRSNVLSLGFTLMREGYNRVLLSGSNRVQVKAPNTTLMYLKTKIWAEVHSLLGDSLMMHILQNLSMFLVVKNSCLVQLCGTPLYERSALYNCSLAQHPQLSRQNKVFRISGYLFSN